MPREETEGGQLFTGWEESQEQIVPHGPQKETILRPADPGLPASRAGTQYVSVARCYAALAD